MNFLLVAALLPAIVLLVYVYKKDTIEKEPIRLIARLFIYGMIAGPLAAITENVAFAVFETLVEPGMLLIVLEYFIGVAAVEEGFKYLFLSTTRKKPEFNYVYDGIVYAVAVSLGFAALENVLYVFDGGIEVAISRAIFSVPGHCADGVVMGVFYGLAKQKAVQGHRSTARSYYLLAFLLPMLEHGFYDSCLSAEDDMLAIIALAFQLAFIVFAMIMVNRVSKHDTPIYGMTRSQHQAYVQANGANYAVTQQQAMPQQQATPQQQGQQQQGQQPPNGPQPPQRL